VFSQQNNVIHLKSRILTPPIFLAPTKFLGWLRHCTTGLKCKKTLFLLHAFNTTSRE